MKKLVKLCTWLIVHIIAFVLIAWAFLGLTPSETYQKFVNRVNGFRGGAIFAASETVRLSGGIAQRINENGGNVAGKSDWHDPYENVNANIDKDLRNQ